VASSRTSPLPELCLASIDGPAHTLCLPYPSDHRPGHTLSILAAASARDRLLVPIVRPCTARSSRRTVKQAIMHRPVTHHSEVLAQPGVAHHGSRAAAHQHRLVRHKVVVIVQVICMSVARNRSIVCCNLAIVLARRFKRSRQFEQPADAVRVLMLCIAVAAVHDLVHTQLCHTKDGRGLCTHHRVCSDYGHTATMVTHGLSA
jgi:hypothetical protein